MADDLVPAGETSPEPATRAEPPAVPETRAETAPQGAAVAAHPGRGARRDRVHPGAHLGGGRVDQPHAARHRPVRRDRRAARGRSRGPAGHRQPCDDRGDHRHRPRDQDRGRAAGPGGVHRPVRHERSRVVRAPGRTEVPLLGPVAGDLGEGEPPRPQRGGHHPQGGGDEDRQHRERPGRHRHHTGREPRPEAARVARRRRPLSGPAGRASRTRSSSSTRSRSARSRAWSRRSTRWRSSCRSSPCCSS